MATAKKPEQIADVPEKATPLEPGKPQAVHPTNGATFAERAAARKAVQAGENKAVKASETK